MVTKNLVMFAVHGKTAQNVEFYQAGIKLIALFTKKKKKNSNNAL